MVRGVVLRGTVAAAPPAPAVVVRDGVIQAIVRAVDLAAVEDLGTIIDGRGAHLIPGLADMHVHALDESDLWLYLAHGVTTLRHMWGTPTHLAWRARIDAGEMLGPRLTVTSPIVDGVGLEGRPIWAGSTVLTDPDQAEPLVDGYSAAGYEQVKAYSLLRPEVLRALGSAAERHGVRMVGHCPTGMPYTDAVAAGMTCFEHLTGLEDAVTAGIDHAVHRLGAHLAERQVWNCPTLTVFDGRWRLVNGDGHDPRMALMPNAAITAWKAGQPARAPAERPPLAAAARRVRQQRRLDIVAALHAEGAPLLAGSDANNPYVFPGSSLHEEIANLVRAGLAPSEALRAATAAPAEFLGEAGTWGVIAPGARADMVLVRGDPLSDISSLTRIEGVFVRGRFLDRQALDGLLQQRADAVAAINATAPTDAMTA